MQPNDYELATPGERFAAALIDGVLVSLVSRIPWVGALIGLAYFLVKDALPFTNGQSIGKRLMKIRVLDAQTGEPITEKYDKSAIRQLAQIIPIFNIIDAIKVFNLENQRRRFGDDWAKTIVVKEKI